MRIEFGRCFSRGHIDRDEPDHVKQLKHLADGESVPGPVLARVGPTTPKQFEAVGISKDGPARPPITFPRAFASPAGRITSPRKTACRSLPQPAHPPISV